MTTTQISPILRALLLTALLAPLSAAAQVVTPAPPAQDSTPFEMPRADDPAPGPAPGADPFRYPDRAPGEAESPLDQLMENLFRRAQPHLEGLARDMGGLVNEYAPVFEELGRLMDDIGNYELPPERLANGDIIIRRKAGAPPPPPLEELPNLLPRSGTTAPDRGPLDQPLPQDPAGQVDL